ncbi:MAG: c-type cytochrome [Akkermansiaceae bacterium]|nr:c-type cytochrome [Akkermansiaceae bacterium]MCP5545906.1 c-type cytochrome [Akkermansiaceae bacterium]
MRGPARVEAPEALSNFRLFLEYDALPESAARVFLGDAGAVDLPAGTGRIVEVTCERPQSRPGLLRIRHDGKPVGKGRRLDPPAGPGVVAPEGSREVVRFDRDFTAMIRFQAGESTLCAMAMPEGRWVPDAKALFVRNGRLTYDIGWKGKITGKTAIGPDKARVAVLVSRGGSICVYLDGNLEVERKDFTATDPKGAVFRIGSAAEDFGGSFQGRIDEVRFWKRAFAEDEIGRLSNGGGSSVNTADFEWKPEPGGPRGEGVRPVLEAGAGFVLRRAFVQPLAPADHGEIVRAWDADSLKRGEHVYQQLCVTCHGTLEAPGSLPTAPRFHEDELRNGSDPYRMFQTLEKGYGQMMPQPQYSTARKYDVIHYIREHFFKGRNESQLVSLDEAYLRMLPRGMATRKERAPEEKASPYLEQDFGNVLFWTLQVAPGNIAQKGIAVRVDEGPGGITKGRAWMLYDHDTMRLAACWTGDRFVDWRGIAFDGSHGTHTSIVGDLTFAFPNQPAWANPETNDFKDLRILGRDGKPYGPLPREWVRLRGVEIHGGRPLLRYSVGERELVEEPRLGGDGGFERVIDCGPGKVALKLRIDEEQVLEIPPSEETRRFVVRCGNNRVEASDEGRVVPHDPARSSRFPGKLTTEIVPSERSDSPWAVDTLTLPPPDRNPWHSWMRTTGFDFFEGGDSAAICTWNGDVWIVDGIARSEGTLEWQRICSGLFQPLGLKIVDGNIHVGCRDMIACLRDLDGDRETDVIECFNSDHQVTEHFHEFAMGLQADEEGNFYYAKSARHAKEAIVPQHGTLLKVSANGSSTEILATGFRAANGVCLNPDGSFMVTDQEGHWNPKNRINRVEGKGPREFYGNMWGYHDITDASDSAMRQPLCWITNDFDRSPAELLWVPENSAWTPLRGSLLNLSYGAGQIFTVPFERTSGGVQGAMCLLPTGPFPTGIMRGRFHPEDGQLYTCGMFAWAGNRHEPGGFYRVRHTGVPAHQPVALETSPRMLTIHFSDPLDPASVSEPDTWDIRAWDLKRSANYGSKHFNERAWQVESAGLSEDGKTVTLTVPDLAPTWGMSIRMRLRCADGREVVREMHESIFTLD